MTPKRRVWRVLHMSCQVSGGTTTCSSGALLSGFHLDDVLLNVCKSDRQTCTARLSRFLVTGDTPTSLRGRLDTRLFHAFHPLSSARGALLQGCSFWHLRHLPCSWPSRMGPVLSHRMWCGNPCPGWLRAARGTCPHLLRRSLTGTSGLAPGW